MLETRNFLVPDATFVIELVAFLVVLIVMTRFVVPRIRARMQARQQALMQALTAARDAQRRQTTAEAQAEEIRAAARREARAITEQARSMRDHLVEEGRRAGVEEYRWLSGRTDRELQRRARTAATAAALAYLGDDVDKARIEQLVDEHFDAAGSAKEPTASCAEPAAA